MFRISAALLTLALSGAVPAASAPTPAMSIPQFLAHQEQLREDVERSTKFAHLDNESKQRIYSSQDVLFALLRDKRSIDDLSEAERLEVFDAQNQIAAVLTDAEADRPICQNTPRLGSHLHNIDCWSKRERDAERNNRHLELLRNQPCGEGANCKVQ